LPTVSKRIGQHFEQLKTFVKKGHLGKASQHLRYVISSNLNHYYSCSVGDWKYDDDKRDTNCY